MSRTTAPSPRDRGKLPIGIGMLIASILIVAPLAVAATGDALRGGGQDRGPVLLHAGHDERIEIQDCGDDLRDCASLVGLNLRTDTSAPAPGPPPEVPARTWLVQAKLVVHGEDLDERNTCGLVVHGTDDRSGVLDTATSDVESEFQRGNMESVALSAVVSYRHNNPRIALRCTQLDFQDSWVRDVKITALEVESATDATFTP